MFRTIGNGGVGEAAGNFEGTASYVADLKKLQNKKGKGFESLLSQASAKRKRLISQNKKYHAEDDLEKPDYDEQALIAKMPPAYRRKLEEVLSTPEGRKALELHRKFWGIPFPPAIEEIDLPGPDTNIVLVGMGRSPQVNISEGPKGSRSKKWKKKGNYLPATDADGKRIFLLRRGSKARGKKAKLKPIGYANETHYIPTDDMEEAGTFKRNKYWVHKHDDDGGDWPLVREDQEGNFYYDPGTYSVNEWIER